MTPVPAPADQMQKSEDQKAHLTSAFGACTIQTALPAGAPGATDAERAAWLADKIVAGGDYAKEAAQMLRRWPSAAPSADVLRRPLGCALAMRVLQSDLYKQLDDAERGDCDELVRRNLEWCRGAAPSAEAIALDHTQRRVVCAAIRAKDGDVLLGIRHYSADMHAQIDARKDGAKFQHRHDEDQGFVDQWGKYMTREEAYLVASFNGQIEFPGACGEGLDGPKLYSEGLY